MKYNRTRSVEQDHERITADYVLIDKALCGESSPHSDVYDPVIPAGDAMTTMTITTNDDGYLVDINFSVQHA